MPMKNMMPDMNTANSSQMMSPKAMEPKKPGIVRRVINKMDERAQMRQKARAAEEIKNIERGFTNLGNYLKLYPEQTEYVRKQMKLAGYGDDFPIEKNTITEQLR
jgi:metal-dependent hydrolase (beta-lactamase superfamily II)